MNIQENVPGVGASAGPSFCIHDGKPFLAWKGEGSDPGIYYATASASTPGSNGQYDWAPQTKVAGIGTSDAPAVASLNGTLCLAWKGENDSAIYCSLFDGKAWSQQQKLVASTSNAPALIALPKGFLMAWKGEATSVGIFYFTSPDGKTWSAQQEIASIGGTSSTPALAAAASGNGTAYMAWKAEPGDNRLFWSEYDGTTWSAQQLITAGTSTGPAIVDDGNAVKWLAWRAAHSPAIYLCKLNDQAKNEWTPQVLRYGVGTSDRPALVSVGGGDSGIMMAWKGEGSDPGLYYGTLLLPLPTTLTFVLPRQNIGQGSATSMAIQAQVVMNYDGSCTFSGEFFSEDSFPEGSEDWYIGIIIKDSSGHAYSFTTSGDTAETDTSNWSLNSNNLAVAQNWSSIVLANPTPGNSNSFYWKAGDTSGWTVFFEGMLSDIGVAIEDVFKVIGEFFKGMGEEETDPSSEGSGGE